MPLIEKYRREFIWVLDEKVNAKIKQLSFNLGFKTPSHFVFQLYQIFLENEELRSKIEAESNLRFYLKLALYDAKRAQQKEEELREMNELLLINANEYNRRVDENNEIEAEVAEETRLENEAVERVLDKARKEGKVKELLDKLKQKKTTWKDIQNEFGILEEKPIEQ